MSGWHGAKRDGYNTFEQWYVNKGDNDRITSPTRFLLQLLK